MQYQTILRQFILMALLWPPLFSLIEDREKNHLDMEDVSCYVIFLEAEKNKLYLFEIAH